MPSIQKICLHGGELMAKFYTENPVLKTEFDKLPIFVRNSIIESGIEINTVAELQDIANKIKSKL